jgi:hypothetical protein
VLVGQKLNMDKIPSPYDSNRELGSGLSWEQVRDIIKKELGS